MRYFLTEGAALKRLETPYVYHIKRDELYELDEEGFSFLARCGSEGAAEPSDPEFLRFCLSEGILSEVPQKHRPSVATGSPIPSLRYLELQITDRCNLRCGHCYSGDGLNSEIPVGQVREVIEEFERMQGLRVLITGGEPLLHSRFEEINRMLPKSMLRKVLFSNGLLIDKDTAKSLNVDEVQISIDGLQEAHDSLRGKGTFIRAMDAISVCLEAGLEVSVSTMVHRQNLSDFGEMEHIFSGLGVKDWTVDVPCIAGRLKENERFQISPGEGGSYLGYGFGGGIHGSSRGFGCGLHLMSVSADGRAAKCTFYSDRPAGHIREGLAACWKKIQPIRLSELTCDCEHIGTCRGGCRFRAEQCGDALGPDLYRCKYYGIMK